MKSKVWLISMAICLAGLVQAASLGATSYLYQDLDPQGALPSGSYQFNAINDAKQIVGNVFNFSGGFVIQAFLWAPNQGYTLLQSLGGNIDTEANGINQQGQIVGISVNAKGYLHACLWTDPAQAPSDLGSPDDPNWSEAWGINDAGLIVGNYGDPTHKHAYKWTAPMQGTDLGTLGGSTSEAWGVNNAGQIVGDAADSQEISRACIWDTGSLSPTSLGLSAPLSSVNCINNQGNAAGYYSPSGSGYDDQVFYWDQHSITDITPELHYNYTPSLSDANQVVGWAEQEGSPDQSIIFWNPTKGAQDLNQMIVNLPKGVTIQALYAISPKNGYIAGTDSQGHLCLLTPVVASPANNLLLLE
jgi:probable HAF family extracellular repeat protein